MLTISRGKKKTAAYIKRNKNKVHQSSPDFIEVDWNSLETVGVALNLVNLLIFLLKFINIHSMRLLCNLPGLRS